MFGGSQAKHLGKRATGVVPVTVGNRRNRPDPNGSGKLIYDILWERRFPDAGRSNLPSLAATKHLSHEGRLSGMLQALGPLGSAPSLLVGLVALAAVILIGRVVLKVAWKLVLIALLVVGVLWILGMVGMPLGVL